MSRSASSYANSLRLSREAKQRRRGRCGDCGAETKYAGHGCGTSERCRACAALVVAAKLRGKGKVVEGLKILLADGPKRYSEIRDALGLTNGHTAEHLNRRLKDGTVVRIERGLYALSGTDSVTKECA